MAKKTKSDLTPLTIEVEKGLHRAVKQTALDQGSTIRELLTPAVEKAVGWKSKTPNK